MSKNRLRVLLLADTHGRLDARIAALARECDIAVHAGDVGSRAVIDALRAGGVQVIAVRGNNDVPSKWPHGERDAAGALGDIARVDLPGGVLVATHGDAVTIVVVCPDSTIRIAAFMAPRILNELVRLTDSSLRKTRPPAIDDSHVEGASGVLGKRALMRRRAS